MAHELRVIPKDTTVPLVEGWVYHTPEKPPADCSWCGEMLADRVGILVCPRCDMIDGHTP